ncbi:alpha/beta hydrolase family protein [Simkania sp.]|uniref:alpha/beta hydrolase family protein n=1 Tax=Simkania sp. TaxID=34094 RepID=UPI003B52C05E
MAVESRRAASSSVHASTSSDATTFGKQEYEAGWGTSLTSFINSRTVMRGAAKEWDPKRLEKKMVKLEKIGGKHQFLTTRTGDKISSFHFTTDSFHQALTDMGGKPVSVEVQLNHPFFESAQPIDLTKTGFSASSPGICIPYRAEMESEFRNPQDFLDFCHEHKLKVFWEDTMEPFSVASWWHWSSRKQNLILVSRTDARTLKIQENPSAIKIKKSTELNPIFDFFRKEPMTSRAYAFDGDPTALRKLFSASFQGERGLKIENSSWNLVRYQGKVYFVENLDVASNLEYIDMKGLTRLPSVQVLTTPVRPRTDGSRATIVLSMNQTNSFVSYSHEILTFLLMGVDVVVYDNAGKGLSVGLNSHQGMVEAVDVIGRYLIEGKGVDPDRVLFKGQCAGGFATSKAMERFGSHGWIDQAPRTFSGSAADMVEKKAKEAAEEKGGWLSTLSSIVPYAKPIIRAASSIMLPSYDVVDSFAKTDPSAVKIYTIGVPDDKGYGGDEMISPEERDSIKEALKTDPNGHFLTITGGTHVTDWWMDPNVLESVTKIFKSHALSASIFPEGPKTPEEAVAHSFEAFYQKPYSPSSATADEKSVYQIFQAVKDQNLRAIEYIIHESESTGYMPGGLIDRLSTERHSHLLDLATSLSKQIGNQEFTAKLMLARRRSSI